MQRRAIVPDLSTYCAAGSACERGPAVSAGLAFLTGDAAPACRLCSRTVQPSMRAIGLDPDVGHSCGMLEEQLRACGCRAQECGERCFERRRICGGQRRGTLPNSGASVFRRWQSRRPQSPTTCRRRQPRLRADPRRDRGLEFLAGLAAPRPRPGVLTGIVAGGSGRYCSTAPSGRPCSLGCLPPVHSFGGQGRLEAPRCLRGQE